MTIGERVDVTFDVLGWTEKEGRRAGYAARGPLLSARVVEEREDGSRVCRIEGLPHPEHEREVAEKVGFGDAVLAAPRAADYAESVLFSRNILLLPLSHDADGAPVLGAGHAPSDEEWEAMAGPYRRALWYAEHVESAGWSTWLVRLPAGHDFVAAERLAGGVRDLLGEGCPVEWRGAAGLESLRFDLHPRDLLFAVPSERDAGEVLAWLRAALEEHGLGGDNERAVTVLVATPEGAFRHRGH